MVVGAVILARRSASRKAAGSGVAGVGGVERGRDRPRPAPTGEAVRELVGGVRSGSAGPFRGPKVLKGLPLGLSRSLESS